MYNGALSCSDFGGKTPPSVYFGLTALRRNLVPAQNAKSNPIRWNVYMQEQCHYQSNNLGALIQL